MANTNGFNGKSAREIMDSFHVNNNPGVKGFFCAFYDEFNSAMPEEYRPPENIHIRNEAVAQLSRRDRDDPNAIYCFGVKRNGKRNGIQTYRTSFNENKTKLLRPDLYNLLSDDRTISFCYSNNPADECQNGAILVKLNKSDSQTLS